MQHNFHNVGVGQHLAELFTTATILPTSSFRAPAVAFNFRGASEELHPF
jgi:hypothetical protein